MTEPMVLEEPMKSFVLRFRGRIMDDDPLKNILNGQQFEFTDAQIVGFILESQAFINETEPRTQYRLERFPKSALLLDGAMMVMLEARGLLHLRNQISVSDAGFSVNLDDKSGFYAQWLNQKATVFYQNLRAFKRSCIPKFKGVNSPLGYW